jgi:hypothetical protein
MKMFVFLKALCLAGVLTAAAAAAAVCRGRNAALLCYSKKRKCPLLQHFRIYIALL